MSSDDDSYKNKRNHGNKIDLARIIAQYQMQTKSWRSSGKHQPIESGESKVNDLTKLKSSESAPLGAFAPKVVALEIPSALLAHEQLASKKQAPRPLHDSTSATDISKQMYDASRSKRPITAKSRSQPPKQKARKQPSKDAALKNNAPRAAISLSPHETETSSGQKGNAKPSARKQNSKSKSCIDKIPKPKRPLSAYNIFFRDQRLKLLEQQNPSAIVNKDPTNHPASSNSNKPSKKVKRRQAQNSSDEKQQKTIGFSQLAKTVSAQWQAIDPQRRTHYEAQAQLDLERYKKERDLYQEIKMEALSQARLQLEMTVDSDTKKRYLQGEQTKTHSKRKK